jgi:hypothetical protein
MTLAAPWKKFAISGVECKGGCGTLLSQAQVTAGRFYIRGHRYGCPKEGETNIKPRTKYAGPRAQQPRPGPVTAMNYKTALLMTEDNIKQAEALINQLDDERRALEIKLTLLRNRFERLHSLRRALIEVDEVSYEKTSMVPAGGQHASGSGANLPREVEPNEAPQPSHVASLEAVGFGPPRLETTSDKLPVRL